MVRRGEVEPITYVDPAIGPKVEWVDDEFALGFQVSRRMIEDDQFNKVRQSSRWLGRSARLTQEYAGASFLDDAFTGDIFRGLDGQPLISESKPFLTIPGYWGNKLPLGTELGVTGMQAAYELASSQRDPDGHPLVFVPRKLIIGIKDEWAAIELTESEYEPYTSDNQVNALKRKTRGGFSYAISHYKNQNGDWFLMDPQMSDAHFLFRIRPEFDDTYDFDTKAAKYSARQRINVYFADSRGWIGSQLP